jgi:acetyl esterase/lipase
MAITEHLDIEFDPVNHIFMDVRVPDGAGPFPGVLVLPGGGFIVQDRKAANIVALAEDITEAGFVTCVADYRSILDVSMPALMHDWRAALTTFRAQAATHNLIVDEIGVLGISAGGIGAVMMHVLPDSPEMNGAIADASGQSVVTQCAVAVSGVVSALRFASLKTNDVQRAALLVGCASPWGPDADAALQIYLPNARDPQTEEYLYLSAATDPILLVPGAKDGRLIVAGNWDLYWDAVAAGMTPGTGIDIFINPDQGHGIGNATEPAAFARIVQFFNDNLT